PRINRRRATFRIADDCRTDTASRFAKVWSAVACVRIAWFSVASGGSVENGGLCGGAVRGGAVLSVESRLLVSDCSKFAVSIGINSHGAKIVYPHPTMTKTDLCTLTRSMCRRASAVYLSLQPTPIHSGATST